MKKFIEEFKAFALRGNVMDMAIGVIIGGAFTSIVTSLTENIINPILGLFGGTDLSSFVLNIGGVELRYGAFITSIINFLIMAFVLFCLLKAVNKLTALGKKPEAPAEPTTKVCPFCCSEIPIKAVNVHTAVPISRKNNGERRMKLRLLFSIFYLRLRFANEQAQHHPCLRVPSRPLRAAPSDRDRRLHRLYRRRRGTHAEAFSVLIRFAEP